MKYWKEKESNPVESMQYWQGTTITKLEENEIFVMGTNPSGIHGAGAAKAGLKFGAKMTVGRGLMGSTYGLITKNLEGKAGFVEKATGIVYDKEGYRSVSTEQIRANIDEMYDLAKQPEHQNKKFLVSYQYESWPNGTPKKSLNGYTSQEMLEMFVKDKEVPPNIVFHESYKPHLEKLYKNQKKQSIGELVVYEDGKSIDIKEEDIVWTIDSDERNPEGIHGAGGAKAASSFFGARFGIGRGLQGSSYALVTKNLHAGFTEKSTGITYHKDGYCSVSESQIRTNIDELYECAKQNPNKKFLITFQYETWPNGAPKKSLNGYTSEEMFQMFVRPNIPSNIVFHDSYKEKLEKALISKQSQSKEINSDVIAFTKVSLPFGWMGNMAPYPVTHEGIEYKTTEALFQALRFIKHPEIQEEIRNQKSPMAAKMVAKQYKDLLINDGFEVLGTKDVENMKLCIKLKLEQHPELAKQLIETGDRLIIEDCTSRPQGSGLFWGAAYQNNQWVGKNVLGEVLMEARSKLQNNLSEKTEIFQAKEQPKEYTFFFHLTSPFSNFHPAKFEYKGYTFISNEQFMMFSKAKNFNDEFSAEKIIAINNDPLAQKFINGEISREEITKDKELSAQWQTLMMKAKKLGRGVQNYDEAFWNKRREKIVLFGAREKFNQNPDLKQILMNTGDTLMVEASPYDKLSIMEPILQKLKEEFLAENKEKNKFKP